MDFYTFLMKKMSLIFTGNNNLFLSISESFIYEQKSYKTFFKFWLKNNFTKIKEQIKIKP
jgi:hypothetical protein